RSASSVSRAAITSSMSSRLTAFSRAGRFKRRMACEPSRSISTVWGRSGMVRSPWAPGVGPIAEAVMRGSRLYLSPSALEHDVEHPDELPDLALGELAQEARVALEGRRGQSRLQGAPRVGRLDDDRTPVGGVGPAGNQVLGLQAVEQAARGGAVEIE